MSAFLAILLGLVVAGLPAETGGRIDGLFAAWLAAVKDARSLVVEYRLEEYDPVLDRVAEPYTCVFTLLRADDGGWLAALDCEPAIPLRPLPKRVIGLLNHGAIYLLDPGAKTATRIDAAADDLPRFLARYFNPLIVLLDRKRAEEWTRLDVVKQDEWYTYLAVTPDKARSDQFGGRFDGGAIAVMNKDTADIPKGMPRALRHWSAGREIRIDVRTWRLDPADAPRPADFTRPEDRPGWTVGQWPFK